jgi:hypothetical protein
MAGARLRSPVVMNDRKDEVGLRAVLSLIFGVLAVGLCPCVGSVVAIVLGMGEKNAIGRTGFWLGWVTLGLFFLYLAVGLVLAVIFGGGAMLAEALN